jgi:hypothetical protein
MTGNALTEQVRLTDKDSLPNELAEFDGLALNEQHQLVGIDPEGNTKRIGRVGELLIRLAKESGIAEEVSPEEISPAAQAIIDRLEQQNQLLNDQLITSEQKNTDLEARLTKLEKRNQGVDGFNIGDAVAQLVNEDEADQEYERGYEVLGFSDENPDGIIIRDTENDEETEVPSSNLVHENELGGSPSPMNPEVVGAPESKAQQSWLRTRAKLGGWFTGRSALASIQGYQAERVRQVTTDEYYDDRDVRAGNVVLVAGALAVGAAIAGYLVGRYTGHHEDIVNHTRTVTEHTGGVGGGHVGPHSLELLNARTGHASSVGISLPDGYHLVKSPTRGIEIIDNHGRVVADHIEMTKTGAISQGSLDELKRKGLVKIGQTHLRYWDNMGPTRNPSLPSAKHPGWNRHTVTILGKS